MNNRNAGASISNTADASHDALSAQDVEQRVKSFYDTFGWVERDGQSGEDVSFRTFRPAHVPYSEQTDARTMRCFEGYAGRLLVAGGGDLPGSHVTLARRFSSVSCLDISERALQIAAEKLGPAAECVQGSILNSPYPSDSFDAVFCAHVIYHIAKDHQIRAIEELIRVAKPGGRIVVIYSNPNSLVRFILRVKRKSLRLVGVEPPARHSTSSAPDLPYALHPIGWWKQFATSCHVDILPWDVMSNEQEEYLVTSDRMAERVYRLCQAVERWAPRLAGRCWQYPLIVLTKHRQQR
jgi:ubiquinone/menaquinone biosynthesis C-methylase UbiE